MRFLLVFVTAVILQGTVLGSIAKRGESTHLLDFEIKSSLNEDGRRIVSINGHNNTYGPTIRARAGDAVNLKVQNRICAADEIQLSNEDPLWRDYCDTALHFHVLAGIGSENDGVPGLVQAPIKTGDTYWYNLTIPEGTCGTYWYHSHSTVQYGDGLRGIMIVECPEYDSLVQRILSSSQLDNVEAPGPLSLEETQTEHVVEQQTIALSDWYTNFNLDVMRAEVMVYDGTTDPDIDGSLINGSDRQNLEFTLKEDTEALVLRLVNSGMSGTQVFHLEGHKMVIMETDGILVNPYVVETLSMAVGQRVTVVVRLNDDVRDGESALKIVNGCNKMMGYVTKTAWFVKEAGANAKDSALVTVKHLPGLDKHELYRELSPLESQDIGGLWGEDRIQRVELEYSYHRDAATKDQYGTGMYKVNGKVFDEYLTDPIILNSGETAELIINAQDHMRHPWHLHGQPFQVVSLGQGHEGSLTADSPNSAAGRKYQEDLQFWHDTQRTPMTRDSINIPGSSYAALRIKSEFEGPWLLHCHVDWHIAKGLGVVLEIRTRNATDLAENHTELPEPPQQAANRTKVLTIYFVIVLAINIVLYKLLM